MISCTINPIAHVCTFCKRWSFTWQCFYPVVSLSQFLFLMSFSTSRMSSFTEFATRPHRCGYNHSRIMDSYQGNNYVSGLDEKKLKRHWSSWMMGKCTLMNLCNTFSKNQMDLKAEPSMFLDLASRMKSLHSASEIYLHRAERASPTLVSILKSFVYGNFLKVLIDMVSFLPSDIWCEYTRDRTCLKSKINANLFINKSVCRFKYINKFEYFRP